MNLIVRVVNWDEGGREKENGGRKRKSGMEKYVNILWPMSVEAQKSTFIH